MTATMTRLLVGTTVPFQLASVSVPRPHLLKSTLEQDSFPMILIRGIEIVERR